MKTELFFASLLLTLATSYLYMVSDFGRQDSLPPSTAFEDYVKPLNYPVEIHHVTTEDSYILHLYRIPGSKNESITGSDSRKQPIILQHGLADSSDTFILNEEAKSIGFILANAGYDVWFGNMRGNKYSLSAENLDYQDPQFWQFSWNEMAAYDLPSMIKYVTEVTKFEQVIYVGHSQGTCTMWAAGSDPATKDYLTQKVKLFIALGPAVFSGHSLAEMVRLGEHGVLDELSKKANVGFVLMPTPWGKTPDWLVSKLCNWSKLLCKVGVSLISDMDPSLLDSDRLDEFLAHYPAGTSVQNMDMWSQSADSGKFQKFDYGEAGNLERYDSKTPPEYDLKNMEIPTAMFVGTKDRMADMGDCEYLRDQLNASGDSLIRYHEYEMGHLGFLLDKDITFWEDAMTLIEEYTN